MSAEKPLRDWIMGSLGNSEVSSLWPTGPMHNYPNPIHQLDIELGVLSRTSRGRALHTRLREAGIDVAGAETALDVARLLEWNPRVQSDPDPLVEELIVCSKGDAEVTLVLLVSLRRALGEIAFSIGRLSSDPDVVAEIIVELLAGLAVAGNAASVDLLLEKAYRSARRTMRRQERAVDREVDWLIGMDIEDPDSSSDSAEGEILKEAVDCGVLRSDDAELIHLTRVEGLSLDDVAKARRVRYKMIQRRRHRAESVVRDFLRNSEGL